MKNIKTFFLIAILALLVILPFAGCDNEPDTGDPTYYTVTFDSMGGSSVQSQSVLAGNPARAPAVPTREGFTFLGWYKSQEDTAEAWQFTIDRVNGDITLYAKWQSNTVQTATQSLTFKLNGDGSGYIVTGISGQEERVIIPSQYQNLPVVEIGESAFSYGHHTSGITFVSVPDTVTVIGLNAFHNRSELVAVDISGNSELTEIGANAFSGNGSLKSVYIPKSLTKIGDGAFNNCGSLNSISVASQNSVYSGEGNNLIKKETNTLIRGSNSSKIPQSVTEIAPSAFRKANGLASLYIPKSVVKIGNYFIADSTVSEIKYQGTEEEWNAIEKTSMWNYGNRNVELKFSQNPAGKVLVAFFSRANENYSVGVIEKGNTHIIAEMIAELTDGTLFHIQRKTAYPFNYNDCVAEARTEKNQNARPELLDTLDIADYDVVFLGYPIWHADLPMPVYTFMESNNWNGKTVIPFCTHEGSGISGTVQSITNACTGAEILTALNMRGSFAQNSQEQARQSVTEWINGLNLG